GYAVAFFDRYRGNPLLGAAFGALRTVRAQRRPLRFLASRLLWRTGLCRRLVIDMGAYRLRFFPTALSAAYWIDPAERAADEAFITQALQAGDTLVDVGANIGALALAGAARVGVAGRVYAIEAHPRVFAYLQDNITLNGFSQMRVLHSAVGAMPGELAFSDQRSDDQNRVEEGGAIKVPVATLDALLRDHAGPIALLKIDVEGFERFVLQGARELLARTQCVFFESWDEHFHRYGYTTADLVADLRAQGFTLFRFAGDSFQALPPRYCSAYCENLVAARDVDALSQRLAGRYRLVSNGQ
ncbi:MAG TPA: FkbM family methyltransferase, partial [Gammaproteobacteria bacterium]|nr:FkbM family methyltransferase [Gammaproteobacteria bacterium]